MNNQKIDMLIRSQQALAETVNRIEVAVLGSVGSVKNAPKKYIPKLKGTILTKADAHEHIEQKFKRKTA